MTETITAPSSTRTKPLLSTDALAVLLQTSRPALTKQLQRTDFPEHLSQDGRTRFWSYEQVEHLISEDIRRQMPVHMTLDLDATHFVEYLGPTISISSVNFWFLLNGEHVVIYSHLTDTRPPEGLFVEGTARPARAARATGPATGYLVSRRFYGEIDIRVEGYSRNDLLFTEIFDWIPPIEELESLLSMSLPVWPVGTAEPEAMMRWRPGMKPVDREIHSPAMTAVREAVELGRLKQADATSRQVWEHESETLSSYLRRRSDRDAVVDSSAMERFHEANEHVMDDLPEGVTPAPQSVVDLMNLWAPDDVIAAHLIEKHVEQMSFAPTREFPMAMDQTIRESALAYVLASFIGVPRTLLEWAVDAEFSVDGSHHHIEAIYARRPQGQWWAIQIPKHW